VFFASLALLAGVSLLAAPPSAREPLAAHAAQPAQSDLDAFMQKVLATRDENWKKLQQYILDERERVAVLGPSAVPLWGEEREYSWYIREGYFVRSPTKANGVEIAEPERRRYEEEFLQRAKAREKRDAARGGGTVVPLDAPERIPQEAPASVNAVIAQARQPQFIDSAYFLRFKFEQGKYALVGRETFDGREVLRIEYYPARLFTNEREDERRQRAARRSDRGDAMEDTLQRLMNKVSLITLWVEPKAHQIVKYTFDNVNFDFLPAAWLVRVDDVKASMTMSQPFPDVWLPRDVDMYFSAMLAIGSFNMRFHLDYHDYREAKTSGRIKGGEVH